MIKSRMIFPRFYLKIYDKGLLVNSLYTTKLKRIGYRMRTLNLKRPWTKAYLKFQYDPKYHNDATVTNIADFEKTYQAFYEIVPEFK